MAASRHEQEHATDVGVRILCNAAPLRIEANGEGRRMVLGYVEEGPDGLRETGETVVLAFDQAYAAIGQRLAGVPDGLALAGGKIRVDAGGRTSRDGVWAGGDCAAGGEDLTVTAVAEGRDAAMDIHRALSG